MSICSQTLNSGDDHLAKVILRVRTHRVRNSNSPHQARERAVQEDACQRIAPFGLVNRWQGKYKSTESVLRIIYNSYICLGNSLSREYAVRRQSPGVRPA